jgi:hypothetical protein
MAIVDAFESMTSTQFFRDPIPVERAAEEIVKGAGKQFDPKLVEAFRKALPVMRKVRETYSDQLGDLINLDFAKTGTQPANPQPAAKPQPAPEAKPAPQAKPEPKPAAPKLDVAALAKAAAAKAAKK